MDIKEVVGAIASTPMLKLSLRERRAHLWISKLRKVPLFTQILDRMVKKESVHQTARWVHEQPDGMKGELAGCSVETIRGYLNCLNVEVNRARTHVVRLELSDVRRATAHEHLQAKVSAAVKGKPDLDGFGDIQLYVTQEIHKLDAATMLRYAFVIQQERVRELRDFEKKTKMPMPFGNKTMEVLMEIAAEIRKVELGEAYLRSRGGPPCGSPFPGGPVAHESALSPEVQKIAQMSDVDKNLTRDATTKIIDLIQMETKSGPYSCRERDEGLEQKTP